MNTVHGSRAALVGAVLLLASGCAAAGGYSVTSVGPPKPLREVLPNGVVLIAQEHRDRKSTRLNSSHGYISYAVFCLKKKKRVSTHITLSEDPVERQQK